MTLNESKVLKFLSCHSTTHVFNVNEVWHWLMDRHAGSSVPSPTTIRKYVRKHCVEVRTGQYVCKES